MTKSNTSKQASARVLVLALVAGAFALSGCISQKAEDERLINNLEQEIIAEEERIAEEEAAAEAEEDAAETAEEAAEALGDEESDD